MDTTTDSGSFELVEASVEEIHAAIEAGETTAAELVDRYAARIDAYDDELNAILTRNPDARSRAERLDERFDAEGFVGPLHGIPIVLKDNHDTHDMPTTAGSTTLADSRPPRDAFVVEKLREAGGVILAKANLQEFSFGVDTVSSLGGETRNAYDLGRRPSGSSGGTAAAIAANLGAIGTGSDTCSSVRSPPAFNNLVGVRPTRGLVSRTGIVPLSESQDTAGPITRTVADAARMLEVMAGYDPADPVTAAGDGAIPEGGYVEHLDPDGLEGAHIGVARSLFGRRSEGSAPKEAADAVTGVLENAIGEMEGTGATIVDPVDLPSVERLESARVISYELERDLNRYLEAVDAPYSTLEEIVDTGEITPTVEARFQEGDILGTDVEGLDRNVGYLRRLARRQELRNEVLAAMVEDELDAILYPPSRVPPVEIPENQPFAELPCEPAAHTGLPSIVLQAGFTDDGLPTGVELLGRAFAEPRLFELAYGYERASGHRRPPDGFGPIE